jgi:hypothetical protein
MTKFFVEHEFEHKNLVEFLFKFWFSHYTPPIDTMKKQWDVSILKSKNALKERVQR